MKLRHGRDDCCKWKWISMRELTKVHARSYIMEPTY